MDDPGLKTEKTQDDYRRRILRVLTHIQAHLGETLDLDDLAKVACFSSYHFHRIFAAMTGETVADHVRRLRLERAATELRKAGRPVIQLALEAGYEAHEAFTRAFKSAYGVSPTEFRRAMEPDVRLTAASGVHFRPGIPVTTFNTNPRTAQYMKVITKKIKPMRVAYLRHVGPYEETGQTWVDLAGRLSADGQIHPRSVYIGMGHDNPELTPATELRYDACITVDEGYRPQKPVNVQTIEGGEYAVATSCPVAKIKDAYQYLYGRWLAQKSRELRPAPSFMRLLNVGNGNAPSKLRVDIHMPLQPGRRPKQEKEMKIELATLPPQRVAYVRHVGPYEGVYRAWMDFMQRLKQHGLPGKDSRLLGVPLDNPKVTPPEKLRFDLCVTVDEQYEPAKPIRVRTIAGGDHVVARNCPVTEIARGYEHIYNTWLPGSGRKARKAPSLLVAVNSQEGMPTPFGLRDICVPLERAS